MGLVSFGIPAQLALVAKHLGVSTFVETGTYKGTTAKVAAYYFPRVYTVEFVEARFQAARDALKAMPQITCIHGNSPEVLRALALQLNGQPTMFWLDAHWNGDGESREFECPVVQELQAINDAGVEAFILVDDARYFIAPPPKPCNPDAWPDLATLMPLLTHANRYVVVVDDTIIAWPMRTKPFLINYTRTRPTAWTIPTGRSPSAGPPVQPRVPVLISPRKP